MTLPRMLSAAELATHLGRPVQWVWEQAKAGRIPATKVGRLWRFDTAEIEAWKQQHHNVDPLTPTRLSRMRQATKRRRSA